MRRQPLWYTAVAVVVSMVVMTGTSLVVASRTARQSEQKLCDVVTTMDEAYRIAPPATDISRKLARDIRELRSKFDC